MKMKKNLFLVSFAALTLFACSDKDVQSTVDTKSWSLDAQMDTSYSPGNDFFMYCNGSWYNKIDASGPGYYNVGTFVDAEDVKNEIMKTVDNATINKFWADSANLSSSFSSATAVISANLAKFSNITTKEEAWKALAKAMKMGYSSQLSFTLYPHNGFLKVVYNNVDTLDYNPSKSLKALKLVGFSDAEAAHIVSCVNSANIKLSKVPRLNLTLNYLEKHPDVLKRMVPLSSVRTRSGSGSEMLDVISNELGVNIDSVYVDPKALEGYNIIQNLSVDEIKSSILDCIVQDGIYSSQAGIDAYNKDHGTYCTLASLMDIFKGRFMNYIYSYAYSTKCITAENRARALAVCEEFRSVMSSRIASLDWMSATTKAYAQEKLAAMKFNAGYSEHWVKAGLPDLTGNSLVEDVIQLRKARFDFLYSLKNANSQSYSLDCLCSDPADATGNSLVMTLVNAFYAPMFNCLSIYPAFLMKPFYDASQSDAYNYASFYSIGHEMTHGFDNKGCDYNKYGDVENWWTISDKMEFASRQQLLVDCYNHLQVGDDREDLKGTYEDGTKTLGENISDLGGFNIALQAYQNKLAKDGYSGDEDIKQEKKFYQAYGNVWRAKQSTDYIKKVMEIDNHSIYNVRINGIVMNTDLWYDLYNVKWGDKLYLIPEKRTYIW